MSEFLGAIAPIVHSFSSYAIPFVLLMSRLSIFVFLAPVIGAKPIPTQIKVILVLLISVLLFPTAFPVYSSLKAATVQIILGEVLVGFYFGFLLRASIFCLSILGTIIAQTLSLSQILGVGVGEEPNTTISTLLTLTGSVLLLTFGAHTAIIELLIESFVNFPPGKIFQDGFVGFFAQNVLHVCRETLAIAFILAAPFLLLNLSFNILLGILNRAMPQLLVTFIGMPAITLGGLILLIVTVSASLYVWKTHFLRIFSEGAL